MSRSPRSISRRPARLCGPLAAALALGALAAPASATVSTTNPVEAGENVTVFHNIDFVATFGTGSIGQQVQIDVVRGGVTIGTTTGPLVDTPDGAALEANHGPAGAPQPGDCFVGHTPDILPRDVINVTNLTTGDVDSVTVDDITFDGDPELLPNGDVIQRGFARRADGTPIAINALDSNGFLDTSKFRGPAHQVFRTPGTTDGFTNVFHAPYDMERNQIYPTVAERQNSLLNAGGHEAGFGHVAPLPLEAMLIDGNADTPGPAPGCEASPSQADRITGGPSHINASTGDITLTGTKMTDADAVAVTLTDSAGTSVGPFSANVTGDAWTLTLTPAQRAGLVDGPIKAAASYDHGGTALAGKDLTIVKDVVAPVLNVTPG
jgi:hypothetical protein